MREKTGFSADQNSHSTIRIKNSCYIFLGINTLSAQIIVLREFMVTFSGNELSCGFVLFSWLFWSSVGSLLGGVIAERYKGARLFAMLIILFGTILPLTIVVIRYARGFLDIQTGEIAGLLPLALSAFLIVGPLCFVAVFMFSAACKMEEGKNVPS